jgi:hypothetical protein
MVKKIKSLFFFFFFLIKSNFSFEKGMSRHRSTNGNLTIGFNVSIPHYITLYVQTWNSLPARSIRLMFRVWRDFNHNFVE